MKLLFAEGEVELSRVVCAILRHQGSEANPAYDREEAPRKVHAGSCGYMVMDVMMPQQDGISVMRTLHAEGDRALVIILTVKTQLKDKIIGLDADVDDYLTKPFTMRGLLARIRSMVRCSRHQEEYIQADNVTLDMGEREPKTPNSIRIGSRKARPMELFMRNPGKFLGGKELFQRVWDENEENGDEQLFLHISYPRQKLGAIQADLLVEGERGGSSVLRQRGARDRESGNGTKTEAAVCPGRDERRICRSGIGSDTG